MYIELSYEREAEVQQPEPPATGEEREEAAEKIGKVEQKEEV